MASDLLTKFNILLKCIKLFKNWYVYPLIYFKLTKKEYVVFETKNRLKIKIRVNSTDLMALTHVWIIQEYYKENFTIKSNDTIIDVGAHIGLFALFASQFCKKGKIFCFEPIKENYDLLLENLELNSVKNIIPFSLAVSTDTKKINMYINEDEAAHSVFLKGLKSIQVDSISLQKIFDDNKIALVDFVKMDCEGSEYTIIDTLPLDYLKRISKIAIEYHFTNTKPELLEELIKKIKNSGFHINLFPNYDGMGFLYAIKETG